MRFKTLNKRFCLTVAFLLTLILITIPNVVNAVPSPYLSGDLIGEPIGNFRHLAIIHEKLDFDFRSLNNSKYGIVKATYQIRNDREQGYSNDAALLAFIFIFLGLFISGFIAIASGILLGVSQF